MLVGVVLLVGGCTTIAGQPSPANPTGGASAEANGIDLPPRPREVRLDGVDPCELLTEEQRAEMGLDGRPSFSVAPSQLYGGEVPACVISGSEPQEVVVGMSVVTSAGIERFTTSRELAAELRPVQVRGFPALVVVPAQFNDSCTVVVDVAPGQLIDAQFGDGGGRPAVPQPQLCQGAEALANAVAPTSSR
ncbi:uncharacterized protein DUF3558 [Pseudonocardia hierapolitana]|uniref:Uncharacterized protein DUF3558 n=2 Tax=Pseudonocardia hierapolitana TaxID=1128676 RepID=A0A561SL73_9PSEU|nr:uncharacterized protein DUF3558 [Pseudonocardia hierapolitana]